MLGFQETTSIGRKRSFRISKDNAYPGTSRVQSETTDINMSNIVKSQKAPAIISTTHKKRDRANSNPFLEADSGSSSMLLSLTSNVELSHQETIQTVEMEPGHEIDVSAKKAKIANTGSLENQSSDFRIWTLPDLTNAEYLTLITLFPTFLSQRTLPRFPITDSTRRRADIEEALNDVDQDSNRNELRFGSGSFWLGVCERTRGWEGTWWQRFVAWWRRIFC